MKENEHYARDTGIVVKVTTLPDVAPVCVDEYRMLQVFSNLLSNAIKYSHSNGVVEISVTPADNAFRVSIKDYGRGIPEHFRSKMFQAFAQADSSDTREKGGTGLGLRITQALLVAHGSGLDYHSTEGVGTEFFFMLPISRNSRI